MNEENKDNKKTVVELGDDLWRIKASGHFSDKDALDFMPTLESSLIKVDTPHYDGPLDLLLHLIKKHSIDIFDIPIVLITKKYLEALNQMESLNLDIAGEFLVMAATLAHIKSQMLLPKEESLKDEQNEEQDPRRELVDRLLQYKVYQEAAGWLLNRPTLGSDWFYKKSHLEKDEAFDNNNDDVKLFPIEIFELLEVFAHTIKKNEKSVLHVVSRDRINISARISELLDFCNLNNRFTFLDAVKFFPIQDKTDIIVTFLSLLEMMKLRLIKLYSMKNDLEFMVNKENFYNDQEEVLKMLKNNDGDF